MKIYKICEYVNGKGEKQYTIKLRDYWWWPAWRPLIEYRGVFSEPSIALFKTFENAEWHVRMLIDKERDEKEAEFKIKKCTVIKTRTL